MFWDKGVNLSCRLMIVMLFSFPSAGHSEVSSLFQKWKDFQNAWLPNEFIVTCYYNTDTVFETYKFANSFYSEIQLFKNTKGTWEEIDYYKVNDTSVVLLKKKETVTFNDFKYDFSANEVWETFVSKYVPSYKLPNFVYSSPYAHATEREKHFSKYFTIQNMIEVVWEIDFVSSQLTITRNPRHAKIEVELNNSVEVWPENGEPVQVTADSYSFHDPVRLSCKAIL